MNFISHFLNTEISHFKSLSKSAQKLIISYSLYKIAYPFLYIFINAFLLRQTGSFIIIAIYNIGTFIGLPTGFYINGILLRKFTFNKLYLMSSIFQGLAVIPLIFLHNTSSTSVFSFGLLFGVFFGLWWANRHYFSLHSMSDDKRNYFEGTAAATATLINIVIPALIGWFIVAGSATKLYSPEQAYKILIVAATVILFFAGIQAKSVEIPAQPIKLFLINVSNRWKKMRFVAFFNGLKSGVFFYAPTLVVLSLIGNEAALGTLLSLSAIMAAIVTYIVGRNSAIHHRLLFTIVGFIILTSGSIILNINFTLLGALTFIILDTIAETLEIQTFLPIYYQSIENDNKDSDGYNYARICDFELFLNIGRVCGAVLFIYFDVATDQIISLRINILLAAVFQLVSILILSKIINRDAII